MDDMERTSRFQEHFGVDHVSYDGLLVIGRDSFVNEAGCSRRLRWREEKTVVSRWGNGEGEFGVATLEEVP